LLGGDGLDTLPRGCSGDLGPVCGKSGGVLVGGFCSPGWGHETDETNPIQESTTLQQATAAQATYHPTTSPTSRPETSTTTPWQGV